jgi:glycosyltransferase involved in cell wall biosynthesis|uniref:Glycosyltransferase n=1 Tax=Desulfobacca acetoxidans TaxID=60893 RepID=A0A7C5EX10_9BACT
METDPFLRVSAESSPCYLSVVIPVFNEQESVEPLHHQLKTVLSGLGRSYEIIYVDDGSTDGSLLRLQKLAEQDETVTVIQLRRNFGQTAALSAGIDHAQGEVVVCQDADLQNDPADIPRLLAKLEEGYDLVSGWRQNRKDHWLWRRTTSALANWLISRVVKFKLHDIGCTQKAYRRELLSHIRLYGQMHRFIPALALLVGAKVAEIPVNHRPRLYGRSKYSLARTYHVMLDLLMVKFLGSLSSNPLRVFGGFGLGLVGLSIMSGLVMILQKILYQQSLIQTPLLLLSAMLFILGFFCILQGFTAELLIRTYHESQGKPTYIIREIFRSRR